MENLPGMTDTAISVLIVLLVFGFCFIGWMIYILKRPRRRANPMHLTHEQFLMDWKVPAPHRSSNWQWWIAGPALGLALLILLGVMAKSDDQARIADATSIPKPKPPQIVSLNDCPKPGPGLTDVLVMVIRTQADRKPTITGCSRIAERSFGVHKKPIIAEAK